LPQQLLPSNGYSMPAGMVSYCYQIMQQNMMLIGFF
jgi:hypothetical protein